MVLDVDSTLIENEVIELLARHAGSLTRVAEITDRAMRGELDFTESLKERVSTLKGLDVGIFDVVRKEIRVTPGVPELIEAVKSRGGWIGVVSGGFHEILDELARSLDIDFWKANRLEAEKGRLTGGLLAPIIDAKAKAETLRAWATSLELPLSRTVAIGDGANDLEMMGIAGLSIAFNAKPLVAEKAMASIHRHDMRDALPLIGLDPV